MIPVAKADRQTASTFVPLKAVLDALVNRVGKSAQIAIQFIIQLIADGHYRDRDSKELPFDFCRGHPSNFNVNGSDITKIMCMGVGGAAFTLYDVTLDWKAVVAACPELGAEPPKLGTSRVEIASFAAPPRRWIETLVTRLRRKPPPAEKEAPASVLSIRLQEMERAGFFRGAPALQDAADYAREVYASEGHIPDEVTPAQFARGLEEWLKARDKVKAVPDQWHTSDRFLQEYRHQS
jgi:hypothetical protein